MANFYRDNPDILFHMKNMDLKRVIELKEDGFADKDTYDIAPGSVEEAVETYDSVLELVGDIAGNTIAPKASEVDSEGAHFKDGVVTYAKATKEALDVCKESQLFGFTIPRKYGGLNCPITIYTIAIEMISRADASFMNIYGLQDDIAGTINRFADEEIKAKFLPRLCSGEVTASMALTEPDAGSDLQAVMVRARQDDKGQWLLNGVKHFITNGNGEISLVLARSEEQTSDGRGLSMFLYERDKNMIIRRIEHKMGIHGSPTCELQFDDAPAILIGQRRMGLIKYVMALMNEARIGVSAQALGIAEAAYRAAKKHSELRVQFKTPIINMIPVSEMLLNMKVKIEAGRALLYETTRLVDIKDGLERLFEKQGESPRELRDEVKKYSAFAGMLTPLCKAYNTEMANEVANDGLQVHGGVGYMHEFDAERFYRDARITNIYEGTTQLQVVAAIGGIIKGTLDELISEYEATFDFSSVSDYHKTIKEMHILLNKAVHFVKEKKSADYQTYHSRRIVEMANKVLIGYLMLRDAGKSDRKKDVLNYFLEYSLPEVTMKSQIVLSEPTALLEKKASILDGVN
ncbi:acyl-CoA dehydrogenase family protein [bacterium]|nr:acyl-CoA dehydrogenase family protein [bacterium]